MARALVLALVGLMALPVAAPARSYRLGKGYSPAIAVAKDGTAHVAWFQNGGEIDRLRYCRIPQGATACGKTRTFKGTGDADYRSWRPFVFVRGQEVTLLATFDRRQAPPVVYDHRVVISENGGDSFGTPYVVGDPDRAGQEDAASDGSGFSLLGENAVFTGTPIGGPPIEERSVELDTLVKGPRAPLDPSVALVDNKEPIVTADLGSDTVVFRPPGLSALRAVLVGAWKQAPRLTDQIQASLAGGPGGVYAMLIGTPGDTCPCRYVFRRWNGTRFAKPFDRLRDFSGTGASTGGNHDLFQDASGRLHAVWTRNRGSGAAQDPTELRYTRSPGAPTDFRKPTTITERGRNTSPIDLDVATAPGGRGLVVWEEPGNGSTGAGSRIRAAAVPGGP